MEAEVISQAVEGIAETLACVEAGTLNATPAQRAYLAGALYALRALLGQAEPGSS